MTTATFDKSIRYDRATGDFAAHLNGELIGFFGKYSDAENALDQVAYDQLMDGGSDADVMAEEARAAVAAPAGLEAACEHCDDTGLIPNGSGTGDQCGGWADTCECQNPPPPPTRPGLIVSEGKGWRVECDRVGGTWLAMVNGVGCIGYTASPVEAQRLCQEHVAPRPAPRVA